MARKDGKKTLVLRFWEEAEQLKVKTSTRLTIEINTIDSAQPSSGGTSIFLRLSRPPLFEAFPPHEPGTLKPFPHQVFALNDSHAQVVGYASRVLRVKLRSRLEYEAFLRQAEEAGLPRFVAAKIEAEGSARFSKLSLMTLQSFLPTLPLPVAFQLEKLVRFLDPVKALDLRDEIEDVAALGDRAERVLARFVHKVAACEEEKAVPECIVLSDGEETPSSPRKKQHDRRSPPHCSSDDNDVEVVPTIPYSRGRPVSSASELSLSTLRTLLRAARTDVDLYSSADPSRLVRQITVTPTRLILTGPYLADSNSISRQYGHPERFFAVTVRNEDGSRLPDRERDLLEKRYKALFRDGIELGGKKLVFLAFSSRRSRTAHASSSRRSWMWKVCMSLPSSSTCASGISTVPRPPPSSPIVLFGRVGLISPALMDEVVRALNFEVTSTRRAPICVWFRLGGANGILQIDPSLEGKLVLLRPSQVKFMSSMTTLKIAGVFPAGPGRLNRPLIKLPEDLGIQTQVFLDLQLQSVQAVYKARRKLRSAIKLVRDWDVAPSTSFLSTLSFPAKDASTSSAAFSSPFVSSLLDATVSHVLREIKYSARLPVPGAYNLVGVLDHSGILEPNEIYVSIQRENGSFKHLNGTVAISRSPTNHPGDLRLVTAVGKLPAGVGDSFKGLFDCVVFSSKGERSIPSMLAGGDLDGDVYLLLTDPAFIPSSAKHCRTRRFFEYITRDLTGVVAIRQLHLADFHPHGLFSKECLDLAQLHSLCVDAGKSGSFVYADELPKPDPVRGAPDFLAKPGQTSYRSGKALGQLLQAVDESLLTEPSLPDWHAAIDPLRSLTTAHSSLYRPSLRSGGLLMASPSMIAHFRPLIASFSLELTKPASLSSFPCGSPVTEEELFLSITLGGTKLDRAEKAAASRRREQTGELFSLGRRLIRCGGVEANGVSTKEAVSNAWAAWRAAVEAGEERKEREGEKARVGWRTWAWLALGELTESLERPEKEDVEEIVIND
ncbi:hypothetical protein JCM8547_002773 [Rhodosporidiobolus lusitaniae]